MNEPSAFDARTKLVGNERAKLTATYVNGLALAVFAVGGLAPLFSFVYSASPNALSAWVVLVNALVCWIVSAGLHYVARHFLGTIAP